MFRNRIFASPISGRNLDSKNRPDNDCIAFYERKAMGGAASVCIGDCVVDSKNGLYGEYMIHMDDPSTHRSLNLLSAAISRHGAVASIELQHGGLYSMGSHFSGHTVYGPCGGVAPYGYEYLEMPEDVILRTIESYAGAAAWAKRCGFGMVTIHGGHGWLLSQFMSSKVNRRKDRWGGSLENRMRLPLAIIEAIRKKTGKSFPIEIRISGSEVTPEGYDLDEGIQIAKCLDGHVDLLHISAGHHENQDVFTVTHPGIFSEDSCNVIYASEIKKHVSTPVATVGAHGNPELMEEIIASGKADVVEMARALLADPDLPKKARRGTTEEIRPCLRCLQCFSNLITNGQIYCAVNPEIGREREYKFALPAKDKKTVLVAGGGIGGMQAAVTAAENGHRVILCEKSSRLGGVLKCEADVPFKKKIKEYLEYQQRQIKKAGVELRLNTAVTPELAAELMPDAIIASIGARPAVPAIKGIESAMEAEEVYENPGKAGQRIVVLGGGLVGIELAIYLAGMGRDVTVMEMLPELNNGGNVLHQLALNVEIKKRGIKLALATKALEITGNGVWGEKDGSRTFFEADSVICAAGQAPLYEEAAALGKCVPEFYQIGDCVSPANIMKATSMADAAARSL